MGYAVFILGHDKEAKDDNGNVTNIRPGLSNSTREIIGGMADIYGYAKQNGTENSVLVLRDKTGFIECGCRFKYIPDIIPMNYQSLVDTIHEAIDKEAAEYDGKFVTDEKMTKPEAPTYDFDSLMEEFQKLVGELMQRDSANGNRITEIVDKYLGKGKKVSDATREQAELIYLINMEIKENLM